MKRGAWWPIGITTVLATTVAANLWVMRIANDDPSFAIEPDYYQKAIMWDSTLAQARRDAILGWRLTPQLQVDARDRQDPDQRDAHGFFRDADLWRRSESHGAAGGARERGARGNTRGGRCGRVRRPARRAAARALGASVRRASGVTHFTNVARVEAR